jgi:hypothetical protein
MFGRRRDAFAETAWACTVYSMVPYLGILFVPLAIGVGTAGYIATRGGPPGSGELRVTVSLGISIALLIVQLFLWWLLYLVPEIGI